MFSKLWKSIDGKKLWSAVTIAVGYALGALRAKYPQWPWDDLVIPIIMALGIAGGVHKVIKAQAAKI